MKLFFKYFFVSLIFVVLLFVLFSFLFGSEKSSFKVSFEEKNNSENIFSCNENWFCTGWSPCINNFNKRNCVDLNSCGTLEKQPELLKSCEMKGTIYYKGENFYNQNSSELPKDTEENLKPLQDCSKSIAPNCGYAYPGMVLDFNEDCALNCFGENFFNGCSLGKVYLEGSDGSSIFLESFGMEEEKCIIELTIIKPDEEFPELEGKDLKCNIPFENFPLIFEMLMDEPFEEEDGGSSTMVIFSAMMIESTEKESNFCTGTIFD
ncbi:MAG: hypothetical protein U9Q99_02420 [Nanoarchaeota archaeon]|nr:hypothetical protein [Nanoarchaeota archaeon]